MERIYLDGRNMFDKRQAEEYICIKLNISKKINHISELRYLLREKDKDIFISLYNHEFILERLGTYGEDILDTFYYISRNLKNISFGIVS